MRGFGFGAAGSWIVAWLSLSHLGCGPPSPSAAATAPATPTVTVAYPIERVVTDYEDYTGRTAAIESVNVMARVTGYLDKIYFREGTEVAEGTVLYEIDPRPYQAAYAQAKAQVAQNEASLRLATSNRVRYEAAFKKQAVTAQDVETYRAQEAQAAATLAASKAALETARLNLAWTRVTAPVGGRLSQTQVARGNLITADTTLLTTLVSLDPMYAYFDVDEATVERIQQLIRQGKIKPALPTEVQKPSPGGASADKGPLAVAIDLLRNETGRLRKVFLGLANEGGFPHEAYVDFFNNQISLSTATLQVRAIFWNPKPPVGPRVFEPGMFLRVRVPTSAAYKAVLVSQDAIGTDQNLKFVYVLNGQNQVVRRDVTLGGLQESLQVVASGVKASERVVIVGLQHVHPGVTANPKLVTMPNGPPSSAPSPGGHSPDKSSPAKLSPGGSPAAPSGRQADVGGRGRTHSRGPS